MLNSTFECSSQLQPLDALRALFMSFLGYSLQGFKVSSDTGGYIQWKALIDEERSIRVSSSWHKALQVIYFVLMPMNTLLRTLEKVGFTSTKSTAFQGKCSSSTDTSCIKRIAHMVVSFRYGLSIVTTQPIHM